MQRGVTPFLNISWSLFAQQAWQNILELSPSKVVTHLGFYSQRIGMMSDDGLGWVWQCNVFGHCILVRPICVLFMSALLVLTCIVYLFFQCRALEAKLAASQTGPGRVPWMSSHQAHPDAFFRRRGLASRASEQPNSVRGNQIPDGFDSRRALAPLGSVCPSSPFHCVKLRSQ